MLPKLSFNDFVKHPVVAMMVILLLACSVLFTLLRASYQAQISDLKHENAVLKKDNKDCEEEYISQLKSNAKTIEYLKELDNKKDSILRTKIVRPAKEALKQ